MSGFDGCTTIWKVRSAGGTFKVCHDAPPLVVFSTAEVTPATFDIVA